MLNVREFTQEDIPLKVKWMNNPEVNKYTGEVLGSGTSIEAEEEWFTSIQDNPEHAFFIIEYNRFAIGFMGLKYISKQNQNAEVFIAIGEKDYQGKGIGKMAMQWLLNYGFTDFKLHKINLGVIKRNVPAVKLYTALGFEIEGHMKDEVFAYGRFHDFYSMALFNPKKNS
jgi:RimJ/RimL family protein N-acetyltransferase